MLIAHKRGWEIPEREASDESLVRGRRQFLFGAAASAAVPLLATPGRAWAAAAGEELYPFARNQSYTVDRALSAEADVTTYNNFYEFGSHKKVWKTAQRLDTDDWTVVIDGLVEQERKISVDELLRQMPREERLYRHRCVEAWSMTVPWSGFALRALVDFARPLNDAKFVRFETFMNRDVAPGQRQGWFPWPFTEGLTMAEATHDLAFMVTGLFGKPLPKANGAPMRLAVPWKYGFKSIKSIVRISLVADQPKTFWNTINDKLYGFWANVNPEVPFPDWSQATEKVLGTGETVPTRLFNGYAEQVAGLYQGMSGENIYF